MTQPEPPNRREALVALDRAIEILSAFTHEYRELSFTQIATTVGLAKSPAHRLITTLERHKLLRKVENDKYALGTKLLEWGALAAEGIDLLSTGRSEAEQLQSLTRETVILVEWDGQEQQYLAKLESPRTVRIASTVGTVRAAHYGLGRVILAFLPPAQAQALLPPELPRYTENTNLDRQAYLNELQRIRTVGYAVDDQEYIWGMVGIGAPVFRRGGHVAGLLGVLAPSMRITPEKIQEIGQWTVERAAAISQNLGYFG